MALSNAEKTKRYRERRYAEIEQMGKIPCACGCGTMIAPINRLLQPAKYAPGHSSGVWNKGKKWPESSERQKGVPKPSDAIAKRTATRYEKYGAGYGAAKGFKRSPEDVERLRQQGKRLTGENNPFYGKVHTEETRKLISEKLKGRSGVTWTPEQKKRFVVSVSGKKHWNWKGGAKYLPYGPDYTHALRAEIRKRDNYTCQRCGISQGDLSYTIHIHHLDHNKFNNHPSNLACACARCNTWANYHPDEPFTSKG